MRTERDPPGPPGGILYPHFTMYNNQASLSVLNHCGFKNADEVRDLVKRLGYEAPPEVMSKTDMCVPEILRMRKDGLTPRRIAFVLGLETDRVQEVINRHTVEVIQDSWLGKRKA